MIAEHLGWQWQAVQWLWLLPLVALVWLRWHRCRPAVLVQPVFDLPPSPGRMRTWLLPLGELLAAVAAVVALAGPERVVPAPPLPPGRDLMLCLDTSSSMAQQDLGGDRTRFALAIEQATTFVRGRTDDRIGLTTFARFADLRCPTTADLDALTELMASVPMVAREGPEDATAIGAAVATAAEALARLPDGGGKVVVLVTDGEENVATIGAPQEIAPAAAAALCREASVRVHAIIIGSGNRRADGSVVPIDTTAVRQLAATTGGRCFVAADGSSLLAVWAAIDALETAAVAPPGRAVERWFPVPAGLALLLWLLVQAGLARGGGLR